MASKKKHPLEIYWQSGRRLGEGMGRPRREGASDAGGPASRPHSWSNSRPVCESTLAGSARMKPKVAETRKPGIAVGLASLRIPRRLAGGLVLALAMGTAAFYADSLFPVHRFLRLSKTSGIQKQPLDEWGDGAGNNPGKTNAMPPAGVEFRIKAASVQVDPRNLARTRELLEEQAERLRKDLGKAGFSADPTICYLGNDESQIGLMVGESGSEADLAGLRDWLRSKDEFKDATIVQVVR